MARHLSAEKRNRQNKAGRLRNSSVKSRIKTSAKKVLDSVAGKDKTASEDSLKQATSLIDKAVSKGALHRNTAARKISRLTKRVNALGA